MEEIEWLPKSEWKLKVGVHMKGKVYRSMD